MVSATPDLRLPSPPLGRYSFRVLLMAGVGLCLVKAKFHYAIQLADLVSDLSQTGSSLDMSR